MASGFALFINFQKTPAFDCMGRNLGDDAFCPWALLSPSLQSATEMRRRLHLAQGQNPQSQPLPTFQTCAEVFGSPAKFALMVKSEVIHAVKPGR